MNRALVLATLALLGASLFPLSASADVPHAVCTQVEPIYRRNGVSFYAGDGFCQMLAADPEHYGWMSEPYDPGPNGMTAVCTYFVSDAHDEYAVGWAQPGYEWVAANWCYSLRIGGVDLQFLDKDYT